MITPRGSEEEESRLPTLSFCNWGARANNFWNPGKSRSAVVSKWVICFNLLLSLAKFDVELVGKCRSLSRSGHASRISSRAVSVLATCIHHHHYYHHYYHHDHHHYHHHYHVHLKMAEAATQACKKWQKSSGP